MPIGIADDLVGNVYTRLTVMDPSARRDKHGHAYWICECECGNVILVTGNNLKNGGTKSCGCLRSERMREFNKTHRRGKKRE